MHCTARLSRAVHLVAHDILADGSCALAGGMRGGDEPGGLLLLVCVVRVRAVYVYVQLSSCFILLSHQASPPGYPYASLVLRAVAAFPCQLPPGSFASGAHIALLFACFVRMLSCLRGC